MRHALPGCAVVKYGGREEEGRVKNTIHFQCAAVFNCMRLYYV
jgi:hypothetical protein